MTILYEDKWSRLQSKITGWVTVSGAVCLNGEIYIFFESRYGKFRGFLKLDKDSNSKQLADMNFDRTGIRNSCLDFDGSIWVFGGCQGEEYLKSVERYDPKRNAWLEMP